MNSSSFSASTRRLAFYIDYSTISADRHPAFVPGKPAFVPDLLQPVSPDAIIHTDASRRQTAEITYDPISDAGPGCRFDTN